jgi:hypothetical protein
MAYLAPETIAQVEEKLATVRPTLHKMMLKLPYLRFQHEREMDGLWNVASGPERMPPQGRWPMSAFNAKRTFHSRLEYCRTSAYFPAPNGGPELSWRCRNISIKYIAPAGLETDHAEDKQQRNCDSRRQKERSQAT